MNNVKKKKINKKISLMFIIIAIIFICSISYLTISDKSSIGITSEEFSYIGEISDGIYYIFNADSSIIFEVTKNNFNYEITDDDGNVISSEIIENNNTFYIASSNYKAGETYTLKLDDNVLTDYRMKDANKIIFKIKRDEESYYKFNEQVIKINKNDVTVTDGTITSEKENLKKGNIILLTDNDLIINAYKIIDDNGNYEIPNLNEIYDEFEFNQEIKMELENMTFYEDGVESTNLSNKISEEVENMPIYQYLVNEAQNTENNVTKDIDFKAEDNKLIVEIDLKVEANGNKFLGIEALKEHSLELKITFTIEVNFFADIVKMSNIDISSKVSETLNVEISLENNIYHEGFSSLTDEEYDKTIEDIVKRIEGETRDSASGKATIGAIEVPTNIPGLNVYMDLYFQTDTKLILNATLTGEISESQTVGIATVDEELSPYYLSEESVSFEFNLYGSATTKLGFGINLGLSIISKDIANVNIGEEAGLYGDFFATINAQYESEEDAKNIDSYAGISLETGIYLTTKVEANINIFFLKKELSKNLIELKKPFISVGEDEIFIGITTNNENEIEIEENETIEVPTIYKQVFILSENKTDTTEEISLNDLNIYDSDGNKISNINEIVFDTNGESTITVTYEYNDRTYKTSIKYIKNISLNASIDSDDTTIAYYANHKYQIFDNADSYDDAIIDCQSKGAHLATISSQSENDILYELLTINGYKSAYFGFTDKDEEGNWKWVTGEPVTYTNWAQGEPNSENSSEDYGMFYYKYTDGKWNDGDFDDDNFVRDKEGYICEWD